MDDLVSIIVPIYNAEKYLAACLKSIACQNYQLFECICIDDGSTDGSKEIAKHYAAKDSRFIYVYEQNSGPSAARNVGIRTSHGKYILFIDADDWIDSDYVHRYVEASVQNNADVVWGNYISNGQKFKNYGLTDESKDSLLYNFIQGTGGVVWGKLYRQEVIQNHSFDIRYNMREDLLFNLYLFQSIKNVSYLDYHGYHYRIVKGSLSQVSTDGLEIESEVVCKILEIVKENSSSKNLISSFLKRIIFWDCLHSISSKNGLERIASNSIFGEYKTYILCDTLRDKLFFKSLINDRIGIASMVYKVYFWIKGDA